jgi:DNA end-binding protein Ku
MPRSIWKGSIGFGLVNVPVAMYAAVSENDLHFSLVHTKDSSPIGYEKVCKKEGKEVPSDEIAKGYELDNGKLVLLDDEDFEAARTDGYHAITVLDFVPSEQIDPIYFERTYFLGPQDDGAAAHVYQLLSDAMEESGLSAVCSYIFHNREHLGLLRVRDRMLVLERLYFEDEIRDPREIRPKRTRISAAERKMARQLIDQMAGDFNPGKYSDSYRDSLLDVIHRKAKGKTVERAEPEAGQDQAPDLLDALKASLTERGGSSRRRSPKQRRGGSQRRSRSRAR